MLYELQMVMQWRYLADTTQTVENQVQVKAKTEQKLYVAVYEKSILKRWEEKVLAGVAPVRKSTFWIAFLRQMCLICCMRGHDAMVIITKIGPFLFSPNKINTAKAKSGGTDGGHHTFLRSHWHIEHHWMEVVEVKRQVKVENALWPCGLMCRHQGFLRINSPMRYFG